MEQTEQTETEEAKIFDHELAAEILATRTLSRIFEKDLTLDQIKRVEVTVSDFVDERVVTVEGLELEDDEIVPHTHLRPGREYSKSQIIEKSDSLASRAYEKLETEE